MNQDKLGVITQETTRMNINILGNSELKSTGMGEFNSDDHYIYYCEQEWLRRNGVAITVNKSPKCSTWMQSQKWQNELCSFPGQTIQYQKSKSVSQPLILKKMKLNGPVKDLQVLPELIPKKGVLFVIGDWNAKGGSQEIPGVTGKTEWFKS